MDQLSLKRCERKRRSQTSQTQREFLDFIVSGTSIYSELVSRNYDYISCLGWVGDSYDTQARRRLLIKDPGEMTYGRVGLYICPECVDPYCGAITVKITDDANSIIWSDFAYDNFMKDDPDFFIFEQLDGLGPFKFDRKEYIKLFSC